MLFLFRRKKSLENKLYPSFNTRLFASLVDIAIAAILLVPISNILLSFFYDDILYSKQQLSKIVENSSKGVTSFKVLLQNMANNLQFQQFLAEKRYILLFLEQGTQFALLSVIIIIFWIKRQSTPGKMLTSLKIVDAKTLGKPTTLQLIIRLLSYVFSIVPLGLGILYIVLNKKRRAWHDLISDTVVISHKNLKNHHVVEK